LPMAIRSVGVKAFLNSFLLPTKAVATCDREDAAAAYPDEKFIPMGSSAKRSGNGKAHGLHRMYGFRVTTKADDAAGLIVPVPEEIEKHASPGCRCPPDPTSAGRLPIPGVHAGR
jgi:hypothetical protein